jgi:hypothetical protein
VKPYILAAAFVLFTAALMALAMRRWANERSDGQ